MKKFIIFLILAIIGTLIFWIKVKNQNQSKQPADTLVFAIQADPHLDEQSDPTLYQQTISNIVAAQPAFVIDLGDIFMVDKLSDKSESNITNRYLLMKKYYDLLGSIQLYLVMGNHDGETGWDKLNTKTFRQQYFPQKTTALNYYAFEQNQALFIILDPYSYTERKPNQNGWQWTLGKTQYDWLKNTLESSQAKYKFIFIHQLVGGDSQGRGGVELAKLYEWGGYNQDGSYGFDSQRPGWILPIHQLLVKNKVTAVFKGHDHLFAQQELDGITYQTVPQPSHAGENINFTSEYGYSHGKVIGGSGFIKVTVNIDEVQVEFIKTTVDSNQSEVKAVYSYKM